MNGTRELTTDVAQVPGGQTWSRSLRDVVQVAGEQTWSRSLEDRRGPGRWRTDVAKVPGGQTWPRSLGDRLLNTRVLGTPKLRDLRDDGSLELETLQLWSCRSVKFVSCKLT